MASSLARRFGGRTSNPPRRPSPLIAKLREGIARANKRAREAGGGGGSTMMRDATAAAGAFALGKLEQQGIVPARIGPVDSSLVIGALGAFVLPRFVKGKMGRLAHDVTLGALCVGAHRVGTGQPILGEEGLEGGGWTDEG
jgi:hypothetical protein